MNINLTLVGTEKSNESSWILQHLDALIFSKVFVLPFLVRQTKFHDQLKSGSTDMIKAKIGQPNSNGNICLDFL